MRPNFKLLMDKFHTHLLVLAFSPETIRRYLHNVEVLLNYLEEMGLVEIMEADRQILANYQVKLLEQTYKGEPLSATARARRLSVTRIFFRYLIKSGILADDPALDLESPKIPQTLPRNILTKKEMSQLLAVPDLSTPLGIRDRAILEVLYSTGLRASELCNVKLPDIDLGKGEIRVIKGKGGKDRLVPLGEVAGDYVGIYLRQVRGKLMFLNRTDLFVTKNGKKLSPHTLGRLVANYGKKANLKKTLVTHGLRHTCATHMLQGKADIRHIQALLGHESLNSTQVYTRVEIGDLKKIHRKCHPRERKGVPVNDGWC